MKLVQNLYFWLWFGFANVINIYLRLKILVVCGRNSKPLMRINLICHNNSESDLFLYTRNLSNKLLKPVFEYKSTLETCVCVVNSQRLWRSKKTVWNVCIKAFWYIKLIMNEWPIIKFDIFIFHKNIIFSYYEFSFQYLV